MHEWNGDLSNANADCFAEAIAVANVPTLLMVLVQLSGEFRWLDERYQTRRARHE